MAPINKLFLKDLDRNCFENLLIRICSWFQVQEENSWSKNVHKTFFFLKQIQSLSPTSRRAQQQDSWRCGVLNSNRRTLTLNHFTCASFPARSLLGTSCFQRPLESPTPAYSSEHAYIPPKPPTLIHQGDQLTCVTRI